MLRYVASFPPEDRDRLFRFLALFARWECALKHCGFVRAGVFGQAEPDWRGFATNHEAAIAALKDPAFIAACGVLSASPPRREELVGTTVEWRPNPRRPSETDGDYLFRVVRDVRNNLFHGGKFAGGGEPELARDRQLIDSATVVLEKAAVLNAAIRAMLEQPA